MTKIVSVTVKKKNNVFIVNLAEQLIYCDDFKIKFKIDNRRKEVLIQGIDDISETLKLSEIIFKKKKKLAKKRIIENFPKHKMIDAYNKEYNKLLGSK